MSTYLFLDVETTGLEPGVHSVWEIAYAIDNEPIKSSFVSHHLETADPKALELNGYRDRIDAEPVGPFQYVGIEHGEAFEDELYDKALNLTLVAANPAFDQSFLSARWGQVPWHYRLFDIESYACGVLSLEKPMGLKGVTDELRKRGFVIPEPNHSAAGDVATLRSAFDALRSLGGLVPVAA